MPSREAQFDIVVIGSGPAGESAATEAAKAGLKVVVIERGRDLGGAGMHRGTIPSKSIRQSAITLSRARRAISGITPFRLPEHLQVEALTGRLDEVIAAHFESVAAQLRRYGVTVWHGAAQFRGPHEIEVTSPQGEVHVARAERVVIATGSRPRDPDDVPVDHQHILDCDSLLSMTYLPRSLTVIGSGVIASEYASILAALGVEVHIVERRDRPLAFLEPELTGAFVERFEAAGGRFHGNVRYRHVGWDGLSRVETVLDDRRVLRTEKVLFALGRVANLDDLAIEHAGLELGAGGHLEVDAHCNTAVPHIYAVGDVVGFPPLAASAMEQGRRAVCHAVGRPTETSVDLIPIGIYTIPEISSVGLTEAVARARHGDVIIGRARFDELARGMIAEVPDGLIKMVADPAGRRLLGVHIIGEGASELVNVAQVALLAHCEVDFFVEHVFNFPTLAEGFRRAAFDIVHRRPAAARTAPTELAVH